ncbi:30S ribosomal protein S6 [Pseudothermotoga thermarum]|uniref:Small ribosomal subunit protein bS6 n=1 Tax=Pseudothermotoga thermarum DSM 5069 TaxID=688269 RepID=F7YUV6_9THEM|nr:30S ribosomal protein S6 [Pseudothermotoga thermarum]AEH51516.1 SSU ribosomal protein S6P [Pseudothermotoga thermarum DSM 5069]
MERIYESMFIMDPRLSSEERESLVEKVKSIITERCKGTIQSVDRWGIRKLAYPIAHQTEGDYTIIYFKAPPANVDKLEEFYRVTPQIIRWQTFRREDLEKKEAKKRKEQQATEEKSE